MQTGKVIVLGVLGYFGYKVFAKKNALDQLRFFVHKVSLRFSILTPVLDIVIQIQNPTAEPITVNSIVGDLFINDHYVANISSYQLTKINGVSATYFPVSARLSIGGIINEGADIVKAITSGGINSIINSKIRFKGYVYAERLRAPLDITYKVL
jgi:LEA14-like dessication related protein